MTELRSVSTPAAPTPAAPTPSAPASSGTADPLRRVRVFGLDFVAADSVAPVAAELVRRTVAGERGLLVVTPNVDHLVTYEREPRLRAIAERADYLLPDGAPIVWAAALLRRPLGRRLTGSDLFVPVWAGLKDAGLPMVIVAADEEGAARLVAEQPTTEAIVAPYYANDDAVARHALAEQVVAAAERSGAGLAVLGLPLAKTHDLAAEILAIATDTGRVAPTLLLIGSAADFYVGVKKRAPALVQRLGLEWLHRLLSEPRRLAKRYLVDDMAFVPIVAREFVAIRRGRSETRG